LSKPLADTQAQLFEDSLKSVCAMTKAFESASDEIVSKTAHQMADQFREMPLRVRQELLVLMEQYQDDPDRLVLFLKEYEHRLIKSSQSPWAKFSRLLKGNGHSMTNDDWRQGLYILLTLFIMLTLPLVLKFGLFPIFQEQASPSQVQVK
jgi:hypothetical protein